MANLKSTQRAKFFYINRDEIEKLIEKGKIDANDIVYTKDSHENIFIGSDLSINPVRSKVYCYEDINSAIEDLNNVPDTYEGQIVSIKTNDKYKGYIVNKIDKSYTVTLLSTLENIDYNTLGNRPITNLTGSLSEPVIVSELDNGVYSISGQYKIFSSIETIFSSSVNHIFLVEKTESEIYVRDISARKIISYSSIEGEIKQKEILTSNYLKENGYITSNEVDTKLQALDILTKTEAQSYIEDTVSKYLDKVLDSTIDQKLNNMIVEVDDSAIDDMFPSKN